MTINAPGTPLLPRHGYEVRDIANAANAALNGKINSFGTVTLTANAASTTVTDPRVGVNSAVFLMPQTANAAAALASTYIAPANHVNKTRFAITHANNAQTDKTFFWLLIG